MSSLHSKLTLGEIAAHIDAEIVPGEQAQRSPPKGGAEALPVSGVAPLATASETQVAFLANKKYRQLLADSQALAVIVAPAFAREVPCYALLSDNPYAAFAALTQLFESRPQAAAGVDDSAIIASDAVLGQHVRIGPGVVIQAGAELGDHVELAANVVIEAQARVGARSYLGAGVTLCHSVQLGCDVRIQAGSVIGAEGFGYAPLGEAVEGAPRWRRIAQLGTVQIGDWVE
ncbi:MAG: UDP-3-O-(3-hydroxymyristoyl)glucosamine N-acyltransferase, partial [Pseudomonadales bacterium]|nr:UDP-3-O-(3-hydroxymyristoyl)glucosamine N-acyltransferase [Pseudomonadales bacterium]